MNSNKIFSLSSALILENMKRYWYVPALSFLIYFMSGIFPILISKDNLNYLGSFVDHSLCNWSVPYVFLLISVPLIASVLMMGFMHKPAHSMAIHSQPFSKSKIFNSQLLSGWIMCLAPILLMVLFYLVFMKDLYMMERRLYRRRRFQACAIRRS